LPRDLQVIRNVSIGSGEFRSVLEFTDPTRASIFDLELRVGDVVEVHEQIPFRRTAGETFAELGIFGAPAGLRTFAGSNRVSVPSNSLIDFEVMDSNYPLVGQLLYIDEGPDAGKYIIEE